MNHESNIRLLINKVDIIEEEVRKIDSRHEQEVAEILDRALVRIEQIINEKEEQ